nr:hypothetical protein [Haloactinospora alba]
MQDMVTVWQRSTTAELCWVAPDGPTGIPVVPLVWGEFPCAALPLAHLDAVDGMSGRRVVFSAGGGAGAGTTSAVLGSGPVEVRYDLAGEQFTRDLLAQEVAKHPPTRLRADSLMARREHWWWVARVLVILTRLDSRNEVRPWRPAEDALLVRPGNREPRVDVVTAPGWGAAGRSEELWRRDGLPLAGNHEQAFAFGHRHSPDFERWERWYRAGSLSQETLTVAEAAGNPGEQPQPFGFLGRIRNHWRVSRACRTGVARAEARGAPP